MIRAVSDNGIAPDARNEIEITIECFIKDATFMSSALVGNTAQEIVDTQLSRYRFVGRTGQSSASLARPHASEGEEQDGESEKTGKERCLIDTDEAACTRRFQTQPIGPAGTA